MIKEAIGIAATLDEARKMAIANLNAPLDADVKVEVVTLPKKKVLGLFGGADAKVKAFYDDGKAEVKPQPKKEVKQAPAETKKVEKKSQPKKEAAEKDAPKKAEPKKEAPKKAEPQVDLSGVEAKETPATEYLKSILNGMGFEDAKVTCKELGDDVYFEIESEEDYGNIIGRRGETLDALQYLTRLFVNRADDNNKRVSLNVGDYRKRREETLRALAHRQANRVLKYNRSTALEPMNPYERRIIHTAIQEIEGVTSHSVGEGERRRVVITPDGDKGDHRDYNRGGRNNRRGGYREKKPAYVPEISADREQKVDAVSSSRYGKIEPKTIAATEE
ncbi:MAG: KH domain-containing protein [Oscillospiraceae bacterium]|nr:KH domain-containing protein [Oscillospiraceae bacterium]